MSSSAHDNMGLPNTVDSSLQALRKSKRVCIIRTRQCATIVLMLMLSTATAAEVQNAVYEELQETSKYELKGAGSYLLPVKSTK